MAAKLSGLGIGLSMASELNILLTVESVDSESVCLCLEFNKVPQTAAQLRVGEAISQTLEPQTLRRLTL